MIASRGPPPAANFSGLENSTLEVIHRIFPKGHSMPHGILSVIALLLLLAHDRAFADEVLLKNGDRISGSIVSKSGDILKLKTDYAGQLSIRWAEVKSLRTDGPVDVMLTDGSLESVRLEPAPDEGTAVRLSPEGEDARIGLERIAYINPAPDVSGRGVAYSGSIHLGASVSDGNTHNRSLYAEGKFIARTKNNRWAVEGDVRLAESEGESTEEKWRLFGNYRRYVHEKHYLYARTSLEHDQFADVDLRATLGGGYGNQVYDTDALRLSYESGLDYVSVNRSDGDDEDYPALGWGIDYRQELWDGIAIVSHDQQGFMSLEDLGNILVRTRSALRFPLGDSLETALQLNLEWDSDPAPDTNPVDSLWLLTLGYKW